MSIFNKYLLKKSKSNFSNDLSLFKDDNENGGIFIKAQFEAELEAAGDKHPSFVAHTKRLIDLMHVKHTFSTEPNIGFEHGMKVIWCRFNRFGNSKPTLCVPNINGMAELIESYYNGKIVVNVDFDGLAQQAATKSNNI